jgi:hypothetical protein
VSKRKKKPRRRELARVERKVAVEGQKSPETQLKRAARIATSLGVLAVLAALAIQYKILPSDLGSNGVLVLKVAGGALVIAGFIFGRGPRPKIE